MVFLTEMRLFALNKSNFAFVIGLVTWARILKMGSIKSMYSIICTWPPCVLSSTSTQLWEKFHQFGHSTKQQQLVTTFTRADDYDFYGDRAWAFDVYNNTSTNAGNRKKWMREYMALFSCDFFFCSLHNYHLFFSFSIYCRFWGKYFYVCRIIFTHMQTWHSCFQFNFRGTLTDWSWLWFPKNCHFKNFQAEIRIQL